MSARATHSAPLWLPAGLTLLALAAVAAVLGGPLLELWARPAEDGYDVERMVLLYATLPRLAMALVCGGALGAAGAILQHVLRNPLASPTTLGIDAGARLALAVATVWTPSLLGLGRDLVALAGSALTTLAVFLLVRRRGFSALSLVLAGLVVSLYCGALASILVLVKDRFLVSLFIWGSGSLSQQGWEATIALVIRLALVAIPVALLIRPLSTLELGDEAARALGVDVTRLRWLSIGFAVALSAFVTSAVGVIGFIGLVAPLLARLAGARRFAERLLHSTLTGALLLLLTDAALQAVARDTAEFLPTGALTAVLGSPLLLLLLPRLRHVARPPTYLAPTRLPPLSTSAAIALAVAGVAVLLTLAVFVGRDATGAWQLLPLEQWTTAATWRVPRIVEAVAAGALLGVAGVVLQRLTANEMASPEVLGVSAGSVLAVALSLFAFGGFGRIDTSLFAVAGAFAVLAGIAAFSRRSAFAPERILLAGVALNALIDAVVGVLSAAGDPNAVLLLAWMAGSTSGATPESALEAALLLLLLLPVALLLTRWLAILPLGGESARSLGVPLARARLTLLALAAVLTASATLIVGPLTFVGLMAPHVAFALGIRKPLPAMLGAAIVGAGLMATADWLARTIAFPLQLPAGLVAALLGAPLLMLLLGRRGATE